MVVHDGSLRSRWQSEVGATMVEYGLMIALVAMVVSLAAASLGTSLGGVFDDAGKQINAGNQGKSGDTNGWGNGVGGGQDHK